MFPFPDEIHNVTDAPVIISRSPTINPMIHPRYGEFKIDTHSKHNSEHCWIHDGRKAWLNTLIWRSLVTREFFLFPRLFDLLGLSCVLLAKRAHCSRFPLFIPPSSNNNSPFYFFSEFLAASITSTCVDSFCISTNTFPLGFEISHVRDLLPQPSSLSDPMAPSWIPAGIRVSTVTLPSQLLLPACTQITRPLLVFCPPAYFVIDAPSPTRQRMDSTRIIGFEYRDGPDEPSRPMLVTKNGKAPPLSLCFRTFLSFVTLLMFVYLYIVLGRVPAAVTSIPSGVQTNVQHLLRPFLTFTTCAYEMTMHDCILTWIAMFV